MSEPVPAQHRFRRQNPCPICGGYDQMPRGHGERCYGFLSSDGEYAHCTRPELAGSLEQTSESETYAHKLSGDCRCGSSHDGTPAIAVPSQTPTGTPKHPPPGIEKAYLYRDEVDLPLFSVLRYPAKTFLQARPAVEDPTPHIEDWWVGLNGTRRVLYRLPEILAADPSVPVFLCEGEKDVDRLIAEGLVATTNPMGARHWSTEYAPFLRNRRVVVLADHDEDGKRGADRKAASLKGVASAVRVMTFTELPEHGDVSDWLDAGHTAGQLLQLAADGWPKQREPARGIISIRDLLAKDIPPARWAVDGILPEGTTLIGGKPKMGKSWLALGIGIAVAGGKHALGKIPVEAGSVLYIALEDSERRLQERCEQLLETGAAPGDMFFALDWPRVDDGGLDRLDAWIQENPGTRLVVVDTLKRIRPIIDGRKNVYDADYEALQGLTELSARRHVPILVVHHLRKLWADDPLDALSGSTGLSAAVDGILILQRERSHADAILYVVNREMEDQELALMWDPMRTSWSLAGTAEEYRLSKERQAIIDLIEETGEPMGPGPLADLLGENTATMRMRMSRMVKEGLLSQVGRGLYWIPAEGRTAPELLHRYKGPESASTSQMNVTEYNNEEAARYKVLHSQTSKSASASQKESDYNDVTEITSSEAEEPF